MKNGNISLSIIIPTIGRSAELKALLDSIIQTEINVPYEVLIVDQNEDELIDELCRRYREKLNLIHHHVNFRGASKARNYGVKRAIGTISCFPDDDAEMSSNTISEAISCLAEKEADCVFGKCIDKETGQDSVISFRSEEMELSLGNFEGAFVEATMFAKTSLLREFSFDEELGAGVLAGSQEAYDLVYRLLKAGKKLFYSPQIVFFHPNKINTRTTKSEINRAFYYSCGFGRLCKKHGFRIKYYKRRVLVGMGALLFRIVHKEQYKYYLAQAVGLSLGYHCVSDSEEQAVQ